MEGRQKSLRQKIAGVHRAFKKVAASGEGSKMVTSRVAGGKRGVLGDITNKETLQPQPSKRLKKQQQTLKVVAVAASKLTTETAPIKSEAVHMEINERADIKSAVSVEQDKVAAQSVTALPSVAHPVADAKVEQVAAEANVKKQQKWVDVDKDVSNDLTYSPEYAQDIFNYYKQRELLFPAERYMPNQRHLTSTMRAILVDWLVEVQENFELNHETLYTAVKLVDRFLATPLSPRRPPIQREALQLIGAAAMFIGCKFDERIPPLVDDFLYICDDAYNRQEFVAMEKEILRSVNFDVGMPISYTFLRRYAKCARVGMDVLTLARYILELSLMHYDLTVHLDSLLASASLWLSIRMKRLPRAWDATMVHYTGFELQQLLPVAQQLNKMLRDDAAAATATPDSSSTPSSLRTICTKYSHEVFFKTASTPLVEDEELMSPTALPAVPSTPL